MKNENGKEPTYSREEAREVLRRLSGKDWKGVYAAVASLRAIRGSNLDPRDMVNEVVNNILDPNHSPPRRLRREVDIRKQLINGARSLISNAHKKNRKHKARGGEVDLDGAQADAATHSPSAVEVLIAEEEAREYEEHLRSQKALVMRAARDDDERRVLETKLHGLTEREASERLGMSGKDYASVWKRIKRRLEKELSSSG